LIHGFVQNETAETWIKPTEKRQNGRVDFLALQAHYGGEGNKAVRIEEAEVLRNNLTYRNERVLSFEKFLTSMQAMFTGFQDNEEIMTDPMKIRLLFQKVQHPKLEVVKSALKVQSDMDVAGTVTYDFIANSMAAEAARLPEHTPNRQASGVDTHGGGKRSAPESGVKNRDGTIYTGFYPGWHDMADEDKTMVIEERKLKKGAGGQPKTRRTSKASSIKSKKKTLQKMKREISSLKARFKSLKKKKGEASDDDSDEADEPQDNAGSQFGGRASKKSKKDGGVGG
jgi:hypothetical protein